ncbi:hypothetical protein [Enterobacter cloacae]|uniref:Phage protein n=1 Tax=Enterobacter cloacae TaxID=550 RepID=A0A6S5KBC7_ENTCL|nr:hypothetical protein [Enterobacter cloacae]BBS33365.1 hypothetical protein WP5S18C02_35710 [Enterobacter cloacae]
MCSPAIALAGASVALSGVSAYNQYQTGKYSAAVAEQNANVAEAQAQDSINRGNAQADEVRRRNRQAAGTQAATMGATGADLSTGGSLDIFGDTAQFGALDALTTVNNAQREAYGYKAQASSSRKQGNMGALTTLLTAPLQAYGAYQMGGGTWSPFTQKAAPISAAIGTPTGR